MDTDRLLDISGLRIEARAGSHRKTLAEDVSLHVAAGEVLALIGESGSGKSMTCLAVMGLLPGGVHMTAGRILLAGSPVIRRGVDVAMVMQNPSSCFDPVMTIEGHFKETLSAQGRNWGEGKAQALEALAEAGFDHPAALLPLYCFQMSGGMLQRVMIALAMLSGPRLLLADEPTTDLDMPAQARVLALIDRLRRSRGLGVLLVTHDLSVAARLADRVAVMRNGRIIETAPVDRIFDGPSHEYTRTLLDAHFDLHDAFRPTVPDTSGTRRPAWSEGGAS